MRQKITCTVCNGTGEMVSDVESISDFGDVYVYVCSRCKGKGYKMKQRSMSLEQFKKLKN